MKLHSIHIYLIIASYGTYDNQVYGNVDKWSKAANNNDWKRPVNIDASKKFGGKVAPNQLKDKPFRTEKLNLLWHKANKRFDQDDPALKKLFKDFLNLDKMQMDLKRRKSEGLDESGEQDAIVRQKFLDTLQSYGLTGYEFDGDIPSSYLKRENESVDKLSRYRDMLKDKRLTKLWERANTFGFSAEELLELKTELTHQQRKVDEYNVIKNEVADMDRAHENSVERFKMSLDYETELNKKKEAMKQKFNEMKDGMLFVEATAQKTREKSPDFDDPRVVDLWLQIKNGNFSEEELEGFKEELKHFERKIHKQQYLKKEMLDSQGDKLNPEAGHIKVLKDEKMGRKLDDYDRKIKKTYSDLKHRINQATRHTEL